MDFYKTIRKAASTEFVEKHSRFIGYISPVTTVEEANDFIASIKAKHREATHNVPAYILRADNIKRFSDDGEPQGTAGLPVLGVLEKSGLTDCAVVVTRYFGGTLLGTGGLVRAYSHSASTAVEAGEIVTRAMCTRMSVNCDYGFYGKIQPLVLEGGGIIEDTLFEDSVTLMFRMESSLVGLFEAALTEASNGKYKVNKLEELFDDID